MACSHTRQTGVEMTAPAHSDMVKDKEYTNWLKVTLALYYMKSGLHNFIETEINCLHQSLKEKIYGGQTVPVPHCSMCNAKLSKRDQNTRAWNCQNQCKSCCDDWLHELLKLHVNQKSERISWDKSDTPSWPFKPWECAKVFMPRGQLHSSVGPAECDAKALMTLLANCTHFHQKLSPKGKGLTHTISIIRNNVMYAGEMKLSDADRTNCIQQIIQLLEDPVSLNSIEDCKVAVGNICKIDNDSVDVFFNVDLQMIALKTAVNEVRQELGMQENRSLDTIASLKMEYRLLIKQLNESLQNVGKVQGDKMDIIENDVKAVNNRTNKALQQQEKLSKSMEIMSKSVDVHDERLGIVQGNITKLQEVIGQRPKECSCCGKEMPWNLTVKDLHEAWQSIESYLLEELAPKNLLTFFEKGNILSVEECKHMCQLKRSEVADKLLQRIKANLPDAFLCLLHALDETKQDVIVQGMSQRIKETLNPRPKTHNQEINGVRCKGPNDLLTLLGQVRPEMMNVHEERLLINCKSAKLKFHGSTPADGNSFFHAVADQLSLMGHPIQSAPDLRRELVNFLCIHETLEGPDGVVDLKNSVEKDWTSYCNDLMRDSERVDATAVFAMAHMLKKDIIVVTSSPGENDHFIQWIVGMPNFKDRPLLLGHVYESHYESLQTHDDQKKSIPETDGQRQLKRMACYSLKLKLSKDGDPLYVTEMKATSHFNKGRIVLDDDIKSQCLDWKHGSVIVYLRPLGKHAKETLAFFCRHGGMKHFVLDLLKKKDIFSSLPEGEITIQIQVCCYDEDSSSEVAGVQYGDHTQIVEEDPLSQYDSSTVTDNPKVIKQNLLLLYGYITEEIEPLQFQDTFVSRGVWDKSFFEQLKKTPRRRARANQFLEEVMNKGNTALEALVHALKISGNDDIANRLCCVRKISSEFMDEGQVDDSMIELVKEDSTAQAQEDMLWSCHLTVAVKKNDGTLASNVEGIRCPKCSKTFDSRPAMEAHQRDAHGPRRSLSEGISDEAKGHEDRKWKCACGKTFVNEAQLTQHRVAKKENAKPFQCPQCCHSYENQERLDAHKSSQHADLVRNDGSASQIVRRISSDGSSLRNQPMLPTGNKTYRCLQCIRLFSSSDALIAHEKAMNHDNSDIRGNKQKSLQRYLENYYRMKSEVNPDDKDTSFEFVRRNVLQILANVRKQEGGIIFKCELRNAGSNATELKIGKADEFDFNIPIDVKVLEVKREGTVPYIFKDKERKKMGEGPSSKNMNVKRELYYDPGGKFPIPKDYAVLVVDKGASSTLNDLCVENHLIPHHLQQKLHSCIREVIKGMDAIDLNAEAHGPAITMNMHPPDDHHISVDLTMIIDWKHITVKEYGWPRLETQQNLSRELIDTILAAGCQLTPKGDEFWNISFSNCESILMKEVDGPSECRKMCHKLLKSFFQTWRSRSKTGYKTISSFIFKHLMFWMNENYPQPGYWNKSNLSVCFLDTLRELLKSLNTKKLVNYFIPNENILGIRDVDEVNELTGEVKKEIQELENINC